MRYEVEEFEGMQLIVRYPKGYEDGKQYPLLFHLHGAGTRAEGIEVLRSHAFFSITELHENFPFITIAPHCVGENTWFDLLEGLKRLVLRYIAKDFCDRARVYCMGASMGGYGTWQLGMSLPEVFSALVPICGGGMYWNAYRLRGVPIWAFHGGKDDVVYPEESQKMVERVNASGGNARLTVYPENYHDAWTDTYKNPAVFEWLLSHEKGTAELIESIYSDSKKFG